jgi:hypothetical protein
MDDVMRTAQRDQDGFITFGMSIADAASGGGVAQPGGVAYTFTRTATGTYQFQFDVRLTAVHYETSPWITVYIAAASTSSGPGSVTVFTTSAGGTATNGNFRLTITALDKRT